MSIPLIIHWRGDEENALHPERGQARRDPAHPKLPHRPPLDRGGTHMMDSTHFGSEFVQEDDDPVLISGGWKRVGDRMGS